MARHNAFHQRISDTAPALPDDHDITECEVFDLTDAPMYDDDAAGYWSDIEQGRYDDDPNPYHGTYSEE